MFKRKNPYDLAFDRHYAKTKRLAMKDPEWQAIQDDKGPGGATTLEAWQKQMEIENRLCPMPLYLKVLTYLRPSRARWHPLNWKDEALDRYQRATRGYSDRDVWNLNSYLAKVIAGSLRQLRDKGVAHPMNVEEEEWSAILTQISDAFAQFNDLDRMDFTQDETGKYDLEAYTAAYKQNEVDLEEACKLFAKHFGSLWD